MIEELYPSIKIEEDDQRSDLEKIIMPNKNLIKKNEFQLITERITKTLQRLIEIEIMYKMSIDWINKVEKFFSTQLPQWLNTNLDILATTDIENASEMIKIFKKMQTGVLEFANFNPHEWVVKTLIIKNMSFSEIVVSPFQENFLAFEFVQDHFKNSINMLQPTEIVKGIPV